ncbi:MAG: NUDIX hydrolase [Nocardioidaceae bacterium]|nr:NUDIX hydrolase [Nocardioidaceae bacterium]
MRVTIGDTAEQWPVHEIERIWQGSAPFSVRQDVISHPSDPEEQFGRLVLEHPGAVVILAVDEQERAFVVRQYRHPVGHRLVELPVGLLDVPGEDPRVAAERELREEAQLVAEEWTHLLTTYSSPGLSSEQIHYYLARGLGEAPDRGADFELHHEEADMTSEWVPVADLLDGFLAGRLANGPLGHAVLTYVMGGHAADPSR